MRITRTGYRRIFLRSIPLDGASLVFNGPYGYFLRAEGFMLNWQHELDRGKFYLSHHEPATALKSFERALVECPVSHQKELEQILYLLGVTFMKLGMSSCALKTWGTGHRLNKNSYSRKFLDRYSNCYGMIKQHSEEQDDWKAFYAVHLMRYLRAKKSHRIGTAAERDAIWELIFEAWKELRASGALDGLTGARKMDLFKEVRIVFPTCALPDDRPDSEAIVVDFLRKRRVSADDRCTCGSGLPFTRCCGRTPGEDEIMNGGAFRTGS